MNNLSNFRDISRKQNFSNTRLDIFDVICCIFLYFQTFAVSSILAVIFSCGLGLGFVSVVSNEKTFTGNELHIDDNATQAIGK